MNEQMNEQMTLGQVAISRKARKGPATKITKDGAYWLAVQAKVDGGGGDGIGQNSADRKDYLVVRHYRSGELESRFWHQNTGSHVVRARCDQVLNCATREDILVELQKVVVADDDGNECDPLDISDAVPELPERIASPDED